MATSPPSSNRVKGGSKTTLGRSKPVKGATKATRTLTSKDELTMAGRILRDIRESAHDLSKRADRLLRRVS
jgi:hypothetical protein